MKLSESLALLSKAGLKVYGTVVSRGELLGLPRPLVLKADTEGHKTDRGMVFVGLRTDEEILEAYRAISRRHPVVAQPVFDGAEFILGALRDPTFGKVIMLGMGGVYAELFRDVVFRAVPISRKDALEMTESIRASALFRGFRGKRANRAAVVDALMKLSKLCERRDFGELDIDPLMVDEHDAVVVDARVVL